MPEKWILIGPASTGRSGFDVAGGAAQEEVVTDILMLPALSSIATAAEWSPLIAALPEFRCRAVDWPWFGAPALEDRPSPAGLRGFLDDLLATASAGTVGVAAGHGATYLAEAAGRAPGRLAGLVLVAPTWRGPLPTMFARRGPRPGLCRAVRRAIEAPVVGAALYRANMSAPVVGHMMREHVYADAGFVTPALLAAKRTVTRRPGGRFGTAAFVTGALDPVESRAAFLALFDRDLPPTLMLRPAGVPARSGAEMDALAASGAVASAQVPGALAAHEEFPAAVAGALRDFLAARLAGRRSDTRPG